jgi:PAS domain S-box-containing protein
MGQVSGQIAVFSQEEERLSAERRQLFDSSWQKFSWLLVAGTSGSILLASILTLLFSGVINARLLLLRSNAINLAAGRQLAPPLSGNDEIAELDRAFHEMAESIDEVTRREKAVIEGTSDAIFVKDLGHRYLMINRAGANAIGLPIDKIIGASNHDLIEAESAQRILEQDEQIIATGLPLTQEFNSSNKAGVTRTYLSTRAPYRDRHGRIIGTLGISRDITEQKAAAQALTTSEKRYRTLVDDGQGLICTHDLQGKLLSVNPAAAHSLGFTPEEMIGTNLQDYIPLVLHRNFAAYLKFIQFERTTNGLLNLCSKAGEERIWMYRNTRIAEPGTEPYVLGYAQDVTDSKRAEVELRTQTERLSLATRVGDIGIWDWNTETNAINWDERMYDIYGVPRAAVIDYDSWAAQVLPADLPQVAASLQQVIARQTQEVSEFRIIRPDGSLRHVQTAHGVLENRAGRVTRVIGLNLDITERKLIETELAQARDAALESVRIKSEFLANMSHEIRTPMNGVIGMTDLLLVTDLSTTQREYAETIQSSAAALLIIINDILDFSKIEAGRLRFEKIDFELRSTVEAPVELLAERAQTKGLELASIVYHDVPTALRGDPGRLRQILTNLIGNAVKFTEHGEVVVRVTKISEGELLTRLRFEIRDTGIGISAESQRGLFRAFMQADGSTTRKYGGTGLGLAISKQLVELMGGEIGIESEPGHGSTFWFTADFEKQSTPLPKEREPVSTLSGIRVLIVDDNATNRRILLHQTSSWGMRASESESGETALKLLRAGAAKGEPYDIAILDLMMPAMDGFQLSEAIKCDPAIAAVALVLLASFGKRGHGEDARQLGIAAYLQKPIRQSQLLAALTEVMTLPRSNGAPASRLVTRHSLREVRAQRIEETFSKTRILVAEDNVVNQRVAVGQLRNLGYRAEVVSDGLAALKILETSQFDIILMDCQMPEMDGFAATAEIRRREGTARHTTIIAMTANAIQGDNEKCIAAGMDDYLTKPVSSDLLRQTLERWTPQETAGEEPAALSDPVGSSNGVIDQAQLASLRTIQGTGGLDFVTGLIDLYVDEADAVFVGLHEALRGGDLVELRRLAHRLRGSSGNMGAAQLASIAEELEASLPTEDHEKLVAQLEGEFALVREALIAERKETGA